MLVAAVGLALAALAVGLNLGRGDYPIGLADVLRVLFGGGEERQRFVVLELRMPRALTGALVGAALGLAGAITQAVVRNPLASPDILGITNGASAAAVAVIVLGGGAGRIVAEALRWTNIEDLADRPIDQLSGGQRQRAWISMALAQGTELLLLDEPTTLLDLAHQIDVLDLIERLHGETGRTVVMVLHDLNLAARYAHRLIAMKDGAIVGSGPPHAVLTEALLADAFSLEARVITDPVSGTPLVIPIGQRHRTPVVPD